MTALSKAAERCKKKFLRFFPDGYDDETYYDWERGYKWEAHLAWEKQLNRAEYKRLLAAKEYDEIAARAVRLESRTNLLFSFENMALRDAIKTGARDFATGLYEFAYGKGDFEQWCDVVASLPRKQTRVLTWPLVTVFGFIAAPDRHIFLKPNVTREAARKYDFDFVYRSRPNLDTYNSLLAFAEQVRRDTRDLNPKDMIDLQSFIWVQGSDEY